MKQFVKTMAVLFILNIILLVPVISQSLDPQYATDTIHEEDLSR